MLKAKIISALCALAVVTAAFAVAIYLPAGRAVMMPVAQSVSQTAIGYIVKEYNGKIGVFESGSSTPFQVLDIKISRLPPEEQQRLETGITAKDHDELLSIIENYSS